VQRYLIAALSEEVEKEAESGEEAHIDADALNELKACWLNSLKTKFSQNELLEHSQLGGLLAAWCTWGDVAEARAWCEAATLSNEELLTFLIKFCTHVRSQTMGDWAVRVNPRLNPAWLERYIDTSACAQRLIDLRRAGAVPDLAREAVDQFLKEFEILQSGKNPDYIGAFDN
jgi:predicted KAP-like P-loop ATPase